MKRATKAFVFAYYSIDISIHALVKRATKAKERKAIALAISIHALVKRATAPVTVRVSLTVYFNPRPREEGDYMTVPLIRHFCIFQSTPS